MRKRINNQKVNPSTYEAIGRNDNRNAAIKTLKVELYGEQARTLCDAANLPYQSEDGKLTKYGWKRINKLYDDSQREVKYAKAAMLIKADMNRLNSEK